MLEIQLLLTALSFEPCLNLRIEPHRLIQIVAHKAECVVILMPT